MTVKISNENGKLTLEIDNGDREKLTQALNEWKFKDYESLLRFVVSALLSSEDKTLWITKNSSPSQVKPANHLLNDKKCEEK